MIKSAGSASELYAYKNQNGFIQLAFVGGGVLPAELSGSYTSLIKAQGAIRQYLNLRSKNVA